MDSVVSVYRAMECREFDAKTRLDVVTIEQIMYSECTWSLFVAPFFPMFVGWHMYTLLCYRQRCILSRFFFYWEFTFCAVQWTHVQPHTRTSSSARYSQTWAKFPILNFWSKFKSKVFSDSNVRLVVSFFSIRQLHICHKCKLQMLLAFVRKPNLILHRFCDGGWLFFRSVKQTNE